MQTSQLFGKRYILLEKLGEGGMGAVYKAVDRLSGQTVALKQVLAPAENMVLQNTIDLNDPRVALGHEFQTLASIRHPHIISVLDYGFDKLENGGVRPYFTMDFLKGFSPIVDVTRSLDVEARLYLILQMLQALDYLHRRKILHHDLKPANVLCDKETVKLLDFGLALKYGEAGRSAGTLAYIAPEVLSGSSASAASDLYAVGIMIYEMLVGIHPYDFKNINDLMRQIITVMPDLTSLKSVELPETSLLASPSEHLHLIVRRLLDKDPVNRYQTAMSLMQDLVLLIPGITTLETAEIRESYLQAANFVGREMELRQLNRALDAALQNQGSVWLVGGESGVGKSRLIDEVRVRALVHGALVLVGQGVADGGLPYQFWRDSIRRLILTTDVNDLEASVLKTLVPDIGDLLHRHVEDAPTLNSAATQRRIINTIVDLFHKQKDPIVLILEDLQWAVESLEILKALIPLANSLPLLIIGTYRDDERPNLPDELPSAKHLKLQRLDKAAIAELSESILGEVGRLPRILNLLQRETEGNVFFLVEVVRALAEQAGQLSSINTLTLPEKIFARGIYDIVERRLKSVSPEAQWALQIAAVHGRLLDLEVMQHIFRVNSVNLELETWLTVCSNAAILEAQEDRWRFGHDKLREGIVAHLDDQERAALHRIVAETIETVYADQVDYAAVLARHWKLAGNLHKEAHYSSLAGQAASTRGIYSETITFLERALELAKELSEVDKTWYSMIQYQLARAYIFLGDYGKAQTCVDQSLLTAYEIEHQGRIIDALSTDGSLGIWQGNFDKAGEVLKKALELARQHGTKSQLVIILNWLSAVSVLLKDQENVKRYLDEAWSVAQTLDNEPALVAQLLNTLGEHARYQDDYNAAINYYHQATQLYEMIGHRYAQTAVSLNLAHALRASEHLDEAMARYCAVLKTPINAPEMLPLCLDAIAGYAQLMTKTGDFYKAVDMSNFVLKHPAAIRQTKLTAENTLDNLRTRLDSEFFDNFQTSYGSEDLEKVIYSIISA